MTEWAILISNVGVGGGLAVLFAWYLLRSLIPSLTRTNQEQRDAFLSALREERREFLRALAEIRQSHEAASSELSKELASLTHEVESASSLLMNLHRRWQTAKES